MDGTEEEGREEEGREEEGRDDLMGTRGRVAGVMGEMVNESLLSSTRSMSPREGREGEMGVWGVAGICSALRALSLAIFVATRSVSAIQQRTTAQPTAQPHTTRPQTEISVVIMPDMPVIASDATVYSLLWSWMMATRGWKVGGRKRRVGGGRGWKDGCRARRG